MDRIGSGRILVSLTKEKEYREVFDSLYVPLCVFANRYVQNKELASDIVQDVFVKLWQLRGDFFYLHQVKAFLYTSVRNRALNELEHIRVTEEYVQATFQKSNDTIFRDHVIEQETYRILTQAINKLPEQSRKVMLLALEGLSNQQIAESMQISSETVHTHKKIAYRKLRDFLRDYYYLVLLFYDFL